MLPSQRDASKTWRDKARRGGLLNISYPHHTMFRLNKATRSHPAKNNVAPASLPAFTCLNIPGVSEWTCPRFFYRPSPPESLSIVQPGEGLQPWLENRSRGGRRSIRRIRAGPAHPPRLWDGRRRPVRGKCHAPGGGMRSAPGLRTGASKSRRGWGLRCV